MQAGQCSAQAGAGKLEQLGAAGLQLSARSMQLLSLADPREQQAYAVSNGEDAAGANLSYITCMGAIRQTTDEVSRGGAVHVLLERRPEPAGCWLLLSTE